MNLSFQQKVYSIVKKIKKGQVLTYKQVAERVGSPRAARAVGSALNKNYDPLIPCHRVIRSPSPKERAQGKLGKIGGYNRGANRKAELLKGEREK